MNYEYHKYSGLLAGDHRRLKTAHSVRKALRSGQTPESHFGQELFGFLHGKGRLNPVLLDWCLSYGGPTLIRRVLALAKESKPDIPFADILRAADLRQILPKDHVVPEFQCVSQVDKPNTTLVCLTGNEQRLNLPVQIFHFVAADYFDRIIYLRDPSKQRFNGGVASVHKSLSELTDSLRRRFGEGGHLSVLGTSSGGYNALRIAQAIGADCVALFSPPRYFKEQDGLAGVQVDAKKVRIYFAGLADKDIQLASHWAESEYAECLSILESRTHGTLNHVVKNKMYPQVFGWLNGFSDQNNVTPGSFNYEY